MGAGLTVTGPYINDGNFITLFDGKKTMFCMALNDPEEWAWSRIGDRMDSGFILTKGLYDGLVAGCVEVGTFEFTQEPSGGSWIWRRGN